MYSVSQVADMLGVSKETLRRWDNSGKLPSLRNPINNYRFYNKEQLRLFEELDFIFNDSARPDIKPARAYKTIELFAGAGGLAIGLEQAGLDTLLLNELDKNACATLSTNRPHWHVSCGDIAQLDFTPYRNQVDVITGGFPCQDLSLAGKRSGLAGQRSSLYWEIIRLVDELSPKYLVLENVPGLLSSNDGRDMGIVIGALTERGYGVSWRVLDAQYFGVAQRRRRVFIVGCAGDNGAASAEILALSESLRGNPPTRKSTREEPAANAGDGIAGSLTANVFRCDLNKATGRSRGG